MPAPETHAHLKPEPAPEPRPARGRSLVGLRVQIVLALAGVILVAYVPLFFAIAQVTRGMSLAYREDAARAIGRAMGARACMSVAAHDRDTPDAVHAGGAALGDAQNGSASQRIEAHGGDVGTLAVVVYDRSGGVVASAGSHVEVGSVRAPSPPFREGSARTSSRAASRALDVLQPCGDGAVLVRVRTDEDASRSSGVVRGIALYMGVFALALLIFAYIALTRAIVRPVENLARAADRVANGARSLELTPSGARELVELASSVRSMAARLIEDENALRSKIAELTTTTRRLGETREQLAGSERMAGVGRLAAGVAHEIGNPIAAIMGMHDLLEDADTPEATRADFLKRMRKETERIHVVVRDLLDYARPENGPPSGRFALADVREIASDALALVRPQKEWKGVDVRLELEKGLRVALSPQRLTQVLLNLLLNAAAALATKATGEPRTIALRAHRTTEGTARIEVEDNGPGVSTELRDRIFDPFVTTKEVGAGTGLGLAVCRGIVDGAGGRIFVEVAAGGQGARFVVELPRAASPE